MKVVVTGGAGFIGSHLCEALVGRGDQVVCVDNLVGTEGSTRNVSRLLADRRFELITMPIEEWAIDPDLDGVECIFHQAASKMIVSLSDPELDLTVNGLGALRLLLAASGAGVPKVVIASTGSVFGPPIGRHDEEHPVRPVSFYGCSKLLAESYARMAGSLLGLDTTVLRYFHVVGPRQSDATAGGVVAIFVRNCIRGEPITIFGDGTQVRSFTSVYDVVRANILAAFDSGFAGKVLNCASGLQVSVNDLAEFVRAEIGTTVPITYAPWRPGDIRQFDVDNSLARSLGLEFSTDWHGMVREVISSALGDESGIASGTSGQDA